MLPKSKGNSKRKQKWKKQRGTSRESGTGSKPRVNCWPRNARREVRARRARRRSEYNSVY